MLRVGEGEPVDDSNSVYWTASAMLPFHSTTRPVQKALLSGEFLAPVKGRGSLVSGG